VGFVEPPNCAIGASLQPSALGFGDQTMLTGRTRRLTLRNTGTVALPIVSVDVSGRDEEVFISADDSGTSVPVGGSCHVSITFSPDANGDRSAKLRVATGDHVVFTRNMTGRGVGNGPSIHFGPRGAAATGYDPGRGGGMRVERCQPRQREETFQCHHRRCAGIRWQ
jgi:hypothetical protein